MRKGKIDYLNARYTGGGIYIVFGHIQDGKDERWFMQSSAEDDTKVELLDACPWHRTYAGNTWDDWDGFSYEWCQMHHITDPTEDRRYTPNLSTVYRRIYQGKFNADELSNLDQQDFFYLLKDLKRSMNNGQN